MPDDKIEYHTIDEYIDSFPAGVQKHLKKLRAVIKEAAPGAEEKISYRMPAFTYKGNLIYFAAFKNHLGLYPTPSGIEAFQAELAAYKKAKGSVQFPLDEPLPWDLIKRIVKYRVEENSKKFAEKKQG